MKKIITPYEMMPESDSDKEGIDSFLAANQGKKIVVVQGLGFVGAVMSIVVANAIEGDYAVIGVDLPTKASYWKIASLNQGVFPIVSSDSKVEEFFRNAIKKGNFYASYDAYAYAKADIIIVDVNLDVQKDADQDNKLLGFDVDLEPFKHAMVSIAENCKENLLLLVESTVPPGTCSKVIQPLFKKIFEELNKDINQLRIGHSYERVMPGPGYIDSVQNFYRVYSGVDERSAQAVEKFLKTIIRTDEYPLTRLANTTATEMAKVMENSFRAMNIAFIEEWGKFAENAEVNLREVVNAIRMRPTHKNIMMPGLGVGGYCLTKDPLMASWASMNLFDGESLPQSEQAVRINDYMPMHSFSQFKKHLKNELAGKRVLILGVSYLSNVGDTRYTPVNLFYNKLVEEKVNVTLHDPHISRWEEKGLTVSNDLKEVFQQVYDAIVFCVAHDVYVKDSNVLDQINKMNTLLVFDSNFVLTNSQIERLQEKHSVKVLGRGDL